MTQANNFQNHVIKYCENKGITYREYNIKYDTLPCDCGEDDCLGYNTVPKDEDNKNELCVVDSFLYSTWMNELLETEYDKPVTMLRLFTLDEHDTGRCSFCHKYKSLYAIDIEVLDFIKIHICTSCAKMAVNNVVDHI